MITERDLKVIDFICLVKACTAEQIEKIFFPSRRTANRSLLRITSHPEYKKIIKKKRYDYDMRFIYYYKNDSHLKHKLLIAEFYKLLYLFKGKIVNFQTPFNISGVLPDAFIHYQYNSLNYYFFLEIQISNNDLNFNKYEKIYNSLEWKNKWNTFPRIIIISNRNLNINSELPYIQLNEKYENWKIIFNINISLSQYNKEVFL